MPHPPSLEREPSIEEYKDKHADDAKPSHDIRQLLSKSDMGGETGKFTHAEANEWLALLAIHEAGRLHANALPHLPHTIAPSRDSAEAKKCLDPG